MRDLRKYFRGLPLVAPVALFSAPVVEAYAESVCPDYVVLPSGSAFNIARLIADTGSPEAALGKARAAVAQVNSSGGCGRLNRSAVCEETMAVARKAIVALEACATPGSSGRSTERSGRASGK